MREKIVVRHKGKREEVRCGRNTPLNKVESVAVVQGPHGTPGAHVQNIVFSTAESQPIALRVVVNVTQFPSGQGPPGGWCANTDVQANR